MCKSFILYLTLLNKVLGLFMIIVLQTLSLNWIKGIWQWQWSWTKTEAKQMDQELNYLIGVDRRRILVVTVGWWHNGYSMCFYICPGFVIFCVSKLKINICELYATRNKSIIINKETKYLLFCCYAQRNCFLVKQRKCSVNIVLVFNLE